MVCGRRWLLYFQSSLFFVATLAGCVLWQLSAERYGAPCLLPAASDCKLLACTWAVGGCLPGCSHLLRVPSNPCCFHTQRQCGLCLHLPSMPAGRRRLLYAGAMLCGLASVLASTAPSLWLYLVFRAASGAAMGGMGLAAYALAADVAGPSWRGSLGIFMNHFFSGGRRLCSCMLGCPGGYCCRPVYCACLAASHASRMACTGSCRHPSRSGRMRGHAAGLVAARQLAPAHLPGRPLLPGIHPNLVDGGGEPAVAAPARQEGEWQVFVVCVCVCVCLGDGEPLFWGVLTGDRIGCSSCCGCCADGSPPGHCSVSS